MLSRLREHFGTAGLVVAIVALIAALAGGAVAATGGSSDGKASASAAKGKPGPRGKPGKPGKPGPAGPQGPAGPAGPQGPAGPKGDTGAQGGVGPAGPKGATGATGKNGVDGETGFTEKLPSEMTETGAWAIPAKAVNPSGPSEEEPGLESELGFNGETSISFPIPLANPLAADKVHLINQAGKELPGETTQTDCLGSAAAPTAEPGHLCVYLGAVDGEFEVAIDPIYPLDSFVTNGASTAGASVSIQAGISPKARIKGSWAVTAP